MLPGKNARRAKRHGLGICGVDPVQTLYRHKETTNRTLNQKSYSGL
jgi:hypothetical protein